MALAQCTPMRARRDSNSGARLSILQPAGLPAMLLDQTQWCECGWNAHTATTTQLATSRHERSIDHRFEVDHTSGRQKHSDLKH